MSRERYGIEELASRGGVSRRTVRFYVEAELLPRPSGAGRGAHYGAEHLDRLLAVRALQEQGLTLDQVRRELTQPKRSHAVHPLRRAYRREWAAQDEPPLPAQPASAGFALPRPAPRSAWTRVEILPGVEFHVSGRYRIPSREDMEELVAWCRERFTRRP